MKLSVIMPLYNESKTVCEIINRALGTTLPLGMTREIIVVDDCSSDNGAELVRTLNKPGVRLLSHAKNAGKGAAIRTGLKNITGDIVVIQDADLEYDPDDYKLLLQPILEKNADVVYGSRFISHAGRRVHLFRHYVANRFITILSNFFSNYNISDVETCYKMFTADIARKLQIRENRFGFEIEVTHRFARMKARMYEVGISYHGRDFEEGKKIKPYRDGLWALYCILRYGVGRG
jgi:glycosyltransferase involved in cell wall biosynthesis